MRAAQRCLCSTTNWLSGAKNNIQVARVWRIRPLFLFTLTIYPISAVRTLALHTQGLTAPNGAGSKPSLADIQQVVENIGCVQIDTLQMVRRSHYLVPWSRLGSYDPADFDRLIYDPTHRRLFEGWQHAASIIPLKEWRYQLPYQRRSREQPGDWYSRWLSEMHTAELLPVVLERIRSEGPLRASDFEYHGQKRGTWWDWKPAKFALEYLFAFGDLMISDRLNFQRSYDLTERVLPGWVDRSEPTVEARDRYWLARGAYALGICTPSQVADYTWMKMGKAKPMLEELTTEGVLMPVQAELVDGKVCELVIHSDNLPLLEKAVDELIKPQRTTFLSPFDNLFWARGRDQTFWGFKQALEAYKPAAQRVWGYFCLPILHKDRLVGRFDPKLERKNGSLRLKALYLEADIEPEEELIADVTAAMRDFMHFHNAKDLVIERSQPEEFGRKLLAIL